MIPQWFAHSSSSFLVHIIDPALRSLVLGTLVAFLLFLFRIKDPSARLTVWTGILYAALAMPLLALAVPSLSFPLPSTLAPLFAKTASAAAVVRPSTEIAAPTASFTNANPQPTLQVAVTEPLAQASPTHARAAHHARQSKISTTQSFALAEDKNEIPAATPAIQKAAAPPAQRHAFPWVIILTTLFCIIAIVMLARIILGTIFGRRLARSAETIGDRDAIRILIRQARVARVSSAPRLAESDVVSVPVAMGVFKPVILLPVCWRNWDERTLAAVIAHEMSHIARRDALTQRLALVHRAIFWFSPLAWWLNRALADAAEEASDEAALAAGADRAFYAETLLGFFAALSENSGRVYWQGVSMAAPGQADRRVDRILSWKGAVSMRIKKSLAVGLALVGIPVVLLAAAARPSATQSVAPPPPAMPALPAFPAAAPEPAAQPAPAPTIPLAPIAALPALAQAEPAAPPAPPAAAEAPNAPVAPQAPDSAPPPPSIDVEPMISIDNGPSTMEIQRDVNDDVNTKVMNSFDMKDFAKLDKQMTFTMRDFPHLSPEDAKKLRDLEEQLAQLTARYSDKYPAVLNVEKQIAGLQDQIQMQVKQIMPVESFQFQVGPVAKISLGDFGDRFVIVSGDSPIIMSGNSQDVEHATGLRSKINGDFIWFQRDEKSYIIRDQAVVSQAKALFKPEQDLGAKQEALGKQQQALGDQQRALGDKMRDVHVTVPDLSADMEKLEAQMKQLSASGSTEQQVGDLERQLGELMRKMGQTQSQAGDQQRQVGEQMRALGDQQRTLGDQQRDLGHQQRDASEQARTQLKQLLDDAIAKGTAQPE